MGGHISCNSSQDELCDYLVEGGYLRTPKTEKVMRAVDRIHYVSYNGTEAGPPLTTVYRDLAWKSDSLHISAPCIYAEVVENLELRPGLSFLNIGSGTGYLSTVVGLFLGPYGVNHGIEIKSEVIDFARERLTAFTATSPAMDAFHFCQPVFVKGCGLQLKDCGRQYDRVYCGATVPNSHKQQMMDLIKVGGILVMPYQETLVQVVRQSETDWQWNSLLPVSFLALCPSKFPAIPELPPISPIRLDEACRSVIRGAVRKAAELAYPKLVTHRRAPLTPQVEAYESSDGEETRALVYRYSHVADFSDAFSIRFNLLLPQTNRRRQGGVRAKREKFDSGVVLAENSDSDSDTLVEEEDVSSHSVRMDSEETESMDDSQDAGEEDANAPPLYSVVMREKLAQLPLPPALLAYLNYYRD